VQLSFWAWSSNLVLIRFTVSEILRFLYFDVLAWNCLFPPIFGACFPQIGLPIILNPKRHFLARKHIVWAIKRKNRLSRSTWAQDRGKKVRTGQSIKSHKVVIFHLFGEKPPLYRLQPKCAWSVISPTLSHVQSFKTKFSGVTILQGVEFPIFLLIFAWALQQQRYCAACDWPPKLQNSVEKRKIAATTPFKVTRGHWFQYQSKARMRLLLVINTNFNRISHRFQGIADYWSNFRLQPGRGGVPLFNTLVSGELLNSRRRYLASRN